MQDALYMAFIRGVATVSGHLSHFFRAPGLNKSLKLHNEET